jgi:hypothetical protein
MKELGTKLYYGTAGGAAATAIAGIRKFDELPTFKFDTYDDTLVDQTEIAKDFVATIAEYGMIKATLKMTDAQYAALLAIHTGIQRSYKVLFSSGGYYVCDGILTEVGIKAGGGANAHHDIPIAIQICKRVPVYTAGS